MSRFSRAEAEAAGWVFVHARDEYTVVTSETQGTSRTTPATIVAEKYVSLPGQASRIIHEEAETEGKLLERIYLYEQHLTGVEASRQPTNVEDFEQAGPLNSEGDPLRTVVSGEHTFTDAEWSARDNTDLLLVEGDEGHEVAIPGASDAVLEALANKAEAEIEAETLRTNEPFIESEQVELDPSGLIDSPGATGTGTLIVPAGMTPEEAAAAKAQTAREAEEQRVVDALPTPRSDLPAEMTTAGPTSQAMIAEREAFETGVAQKVEDTVEEDGLGAAQGDDAYADQIEAGLSEQSDAQDEIADDAGDQEHDEPVDIDVELSPTGTDASPQEPVEPSPPAEIPLDPEVSTDIQESVEASQPDAPVEPETVEAHEVTTEPEAEKNDDEALQQETQAPPIFQPPAE